MQETYLHFTFCPPGRSNSSSSEASTPEAGGPDCRQPPPLLRTISEGTYTTIDSLSSTSSFSRADLSSSFSRADLSVFDPQDAIIDDTSWDLQQRLSLEVLKPNWNAEGLDKVDSAGPLLKNEGIKNLEPISNHVPYSDPQPSNMQSDLECTQL